MSGRTLRIDLTVLLLLVLFSSLGGALNPHVGAVQQAVVTIGDSSYSPQEVTVVVGSTVLWKNTGSSSHASISDTGLWNSGPIAPGATYQSPLLTSVGVVNYHSFSSDPSQMRGKIIVVSASANTLYAGRIDEGLLASFVISLLFAVVVIFWLNYPSSQSKAKARMR